MSLFEPRESIRRLFSWKIDSGIDPPNSLSDSRIKYKEDDVGKSLSFPESRFDERSSVCNAGRVYIKSGISPDSKQQSG
jgi:hypothetical protein